MLRRQIRGVGRTQGEVGHVGAAEMVVEHPVGRADGMLRLEPFGGVVVDPDLTDTVDGDHQGCHGYPQDQLGMPVGAPAGSPQQPTEQG